jgi:hypothetical protein
MHDFVVRSITCCVHQCFAITPSVKAKIGIQLSLLYSLPYNRDKTTIDSRSVISYFLHPLFNAFNLHLGLDS